MPPHVDTGPFLLDSYFMHTGIVLSTGSYWILGYQLKPNCIQSWALLAGLMCLLWVVLHCKAEIKKKKKTFYLLMDLLLCLQIQIKLKIIVECVFIPCEKKPLQSTFLLYTECLKKKTTSDGTVQFFCYLSTALTVEDLAKLELRK